MRKPGTTMVPFLLLAVGLLLGHATLASAAVPCRVQETSANGRVRLRLDSDCDGLSNKTERALGTNRRDADSDDDGLNDGDEVLQTGTDPMDADTDDDGLSDGEEVQQTGSE